MGRKIVVALGGNAILVDNPTAEAQKQAGVGAQVAAEIAERSILSLEAPIGRIAAPDTVFPFGQAEGAWLPNAKDIEDKVREIANF